jgi:hypothetical protein
LQIFRARDFPSREHSLERQQLQARLTGRVTIFGTVISPMLLLSRRQLTGNRRNQKNQPHLLETPAPVTV